MHYRTIFLSDIHLGTPGCDADAVLDFLREHDADTIFLIGDIIDGWRLRRSVFWPQSHNDVVQKLLRKARQGSRIVYVPGNHDEALREFDGQNFGGVEVARESEHVTADGLRLLILHGDEFDAITTYNRWLAVVGDHAYAASLVANRWFNWWRRKLGFGYWSLSAFLKHNVKQAVSFIGDYEQSVAAECHRRGFDGIVCGHIHHADMRPMGGVLYCNTGDWVESRTALVEHHDGRLELLDHGALACA